VAVINPIRVLSNEVVLDASSAVKKYFELCADAETGYIVLPQGEDHAMVVALNDAIKRVGVSQGLLLAALENISNEQIEAPAFPGLVDGLQSAVTITNIAINDTYNAPEMIIKLLSKNLAVVEQQNSHIDNYVESFRIALDENCTAILASLADQILAK
jgi:hypothetical protein